MSRSWVFELLRTGENIGDGRVMIDGLGVHRLNDGDVVGNAANVRQSLVHPCAVLAHALEFKHRSDTGERFLAASHGGQPLAVADGFGSSSPWKSRIAGL